MKLKKNSIYIKGVYGSPSNAMRYIKHLSLSFLILSVSGCSDFVEADPPKNTLITETVFEDVKTAESALANIYVKMRDQGLVSGASGLSIAIGIYADELDYYGFNSNSLNLYNHNVTASDVTVSGWWSHAYNLIYAANDIIGGVENSASITLEDQEELKGQALFVRAYLHGLLVTLYGDIPYIETTNYLENIKVARMPVNLVYEKIIADLSLAVSLLDDASGERVLPNKSTANALLARMYLYSENWALAETTATSVIDAHTLESDLSKVFLKGSQETLWQFKPKESNPNNTQEAGQLIILTVPTFGRALTTSLIGAFESGDLRQSSWTGSVTSTDGTNITLHFAHKYKETVFTTTLSLEYSIIFRLAEQYLIRAEARAHLNDITGAQQDLNVIRNRAGLANTTVATMNDLLDAVLQERRVELFTEHGHRWFDLKRTGKAAEVLAPIKTNWQDTNTLLPIPDTELLANPNLKPQNSGY